MSDSTTTENNNEKKSKILILNNSLTQIGPQGFRGFQGASAIQPVFNPGFGYFTFKSAIGSSGELGPNFARTEIPIAYLDDPTLNKVYCRIPFTTAIQQLGVTATNIVILPDIIQFPIGGYPQAPIAPVTIQNSYVYTTFNLVPGTWKVDWYSNIEWSVSDPNIYPGGTAISYNQFALAVAANAASPPIVIPQSIRKAYTISTFPLSPNSQQGFVRGSAIIEVISPVAEYMVLFYRGTLDANSVLPAYSPIEFLPSRTVGLDFEQTSIEFVKLK